MLPRKLLSGRLPQRCTVGTAADRFNDHTGVGIHGALRGPHSQRARALGQVSPPAAPPEPALTAARDCVPLIHPGIVVVGGRGLQVNAGEGRESGEGAPAPGHLLQSQTRGCGAPSPPPPQRAGGHPDSTRKPPRELLGSPLAVRALPIPSARPSSLPRQGRRDKGACDFGAGGEGTKTDARRGRRKRREHLGEARPAETSGLPGSPRSEDLESHRPVRSRAHRRRPPALPFRTQLTDHSPPRTRGKTATTSSSPTHWLAPLSFLAARLPC